METMQVYYQIIHENLVATEYWNKGYTHTQGL